MEHPGSEQRGLVVVITLRCMLIWCTRRGRTSFLQVAGDRRKGGRLDLAAALAQRVLGAADPLCDIRAKYLGTPPRGISGRNSCSHFTVSQQLGLNNWPSPEGT